MGKLPKSWLDNPQYLPTVIPAASPIYWMEAVDSVSQSDARISGNQNSAATLTYYTQDEAVTDQDLQAALFRTILGGPDRDTNKYPPLAHPYFPDMYAKDIVSIRRMGGKGIGTIGVGPFAKFNIAELKISFETLDYAVCGTEGAEEYNWRQIKIAVSNSRVTQLFGIYNLKLPGPPVTYKPLQLGTQKIRPEGAYRDTCYRVPAHLIGDNIDTLIDIQGKVNSQPYRGFAAETVLFNGFSCDPVWSDWTGMAVTNVHFDMLYIDWGWNKQLDPLTGTLYDVVAGQTTNKPFESIDFADLFEAVNPVSAMVPCGEAH